MLRVIKYGVTQNLELALARPAQDLATHEHAIKNIVEDVQKEGDDAIMRYTLLFDKVRLERMVLPARLLMEAGNQLDTHLREAIDKAAANITAFHKARPSTDYALETVPGVMCSRRAVPIQKVGLYVPGGTAPLFSSVLMLGIPARLAGCKQVILCTPPDKQGNVHPAILYAAQVAGITTVFTVGGAQAIVAMALGTRTIPRVHKIAGPGNSYVTAAKQYVQRFGVAIDMPAGPSEVMVYAGVSARPDFIAADLLSQAEHGPDSQVVLVTASEKMIEDVNTELERQLANLPRRELAATALSHSRAVLVPSENQAIEVANAYAPEHLIICCDNAEALAQKVVNAGSVFIGHYTPESAGDYASGTNHTLPTNGAARAYSGVSVDTFQKHITFQKISKEGLERLGPIVETMAAAEELQAHKEAVSIRLDDIRRNNA